MKKEEKGAGHNKSGDHKTEKRRTGRYSKKLVKKKIDTGADYRSSAGFYNPGSGISRKTKLPLKRQKCRTGQEQFTCKKPPEAALNAKAGNGIPYKQKPDNQRKSVQKKGKKRLSPAI